MLMEETTSPSLLTSARKSPSLWWVSPSEMVDERGTLKVGEEVS